jgi:FlaA1/EpsC-like NDP-sugar epimerase
MQRVMRSHRPFSVFHAAAHKHVPLMEQNVAEAVLNNVLGTRNVVTLSAEVESEHFVLVSTDKAVRPTSVMGATKRIAELVVHETASHQLSGYVSVRFGNVLGSRGSVVPTFIKQISTGGPVTITHPDMTRYFMTIPEAVQLVLQAAAMGEHGEVFVLDMGEPVRVVDLAADLIRLSGLEVDRDIDIRYTGLRPGEKLYEELFFSSDTAVATPHPKILRAREVDMSAQVAAIDALIEAAAANVPQREIRRLIRAIVPEYSGGVADTDEFISIGEERGSVTPQRTSKPIIQLTGH